MTPEADAARVGAPSIVVVGSSNTDLTVLADRLPTPGETVLGGQLIQAGGGKGANQAVAAARAGARVAFVGRIGEDAFGRAALAALRGEGVDVDLVAVDTEAASGVALIIVGRHGENLIAVAPGANSRVGPVDVRRAEDRIAAADMLVLQLEIPLEAVTEAVRLARRHSVPVLLNPAPSPQCGLPEEVLKGIEYLVPNLGEAACISGMPPTESPEAMARALNRAGAGAVIITLGADGACVCRGGDCTRIEAPRVDAVDTVGAGDCFCGVLAVGLAEGMALPRAAEFAACAAALSVQEPGAQSSLPHRAAIERLLKEQAKR